MSRGIPRAGKRAPRRIRDAAGNLVPPDQAGRFVERITKSVRLGDGRETDEQVHERIRERFDILQELVESCLTGKSRALISSGPPGLGKSYTVEQTIAAWDPEGESHAIVKGYVRPTGLYKLLYEYRHPGNVIVFDDADSVFHDELGLNILKAVCDTTRHRRVSWLSEGVLFDSTGDPIPHTFDFEGAVIFITNQDFDFLIDKGHQLGPHFAALVSRAHYVDLTIKDKRDKLIRIRQVADEGVLLGFLDDTAKEEVLSWMEEHSDSLRELSLRMALKVGLLRRDGPRWERIARVTCCRN